MAVILELSKAQQNAIESTWNGVITMVLSTAGSGKTLTLTRRAVRIAKELVRNKEPARVLCICFNKGAADEIAVRLSYLLKEQSLGTTIGVTRNGIALNLDVVIEVRTFHALGYWVLRTSCGAQRQELGLNPGPIKLLSGKEHVQFVINILREVTEIEPYADERREKKVRATAKKKLSSFLEYKLKRSDAEARQALNLSSGGVDMNMLNEQPPRWYDLYEARLQENGYIDYNDMICKTTKLIELNQAAREKLQSRYIAVLVDEFQDMSPSDFAMCKALVEKSKSLTVVGDDDQKIYSFRSSLSWFCHETIQEVFKGIVKVYPLDENRRCPGFIVKCADVVIKKNTRRMAKSMYATHESGSPLRIVGCRTQELEMMFVIKRIKLLLPTVSDSSEQILLLFRTNAVLNAFQKTLRLGGIETSRVLGVMRKTDPIGIKTFATFALVSLMLRTVDETTFVWAACIISAGLDRKTMEWILTEVNRLPAQPRICQRVKQVDPEDKVGGAQLPSSLLLRVQTWYHEQKRQDTDFANQPWFDSLHILFLRCDKLNLRVRKVKTMEELLTSARGIISSASGSEFDSFPEDMGSQTEQPHALVDDGGNSGFDLLLGAARKLDKDWSEVEACGERADKGLTSGSDDDFTALFSQDEHLRAHKRARIRKTSNQTHVSNSAAGMRKELIRKIEALCNAMHAVLAVSNDPESRKASYPNRKVVVLSTIHKAKGSQFPYVFLCGADKHNIPNGVSAHCYGRIPHPTSLGPPDMHNDHVQEERRMLFVSITRAQREFTCTYSGNKGVDQSPFLDELLEGVKPFKEACVKEYFIEQEMGIFEITREMQESIAT